MRTNPVLAAFPFLLGTPESGLADPSPDPAAVAKAYYGAFRGEVELDAVPMADDLRFTSPRFTLEGAPAFRRALADLLPRVRSLAMRDQLVGRGRVLSLYQLDLGAPDGPIPMAERLGVERGAIAEVELIFDASRLPPAPAPAE